MLHLLWTQMSRIDQDDAVNYVGGIEQPARTQVERNLVPNLTECSSPILDQRGRWNCPPVGFPGLNLENSASVRATHHFGTQERD
jgi:hypothetical protein